MVDPAKQGPELSKVQQIAELVKRLCTALTNVEMFSADHPVAKKAINGAYECLAGMLKTTKAPVVISVSGKTVVLDGLPLEERNPLVAKFGAKFNEFHIPNLFFEPEVTAKEFHDLFRAFGKGSKHVNAAGGVAVLLEKAAATHITIKEVSYVMVTGDEKVVSRDARVVEGGGGGDAGPDSEIARYLVQKVLEKADEQKWLINEMKNNPQKVAEMIVQGIDLAASRAEAGMSDEDGTVATLLSNIRLVGRSLVDEQTGEVKDGEDDLEKSLVTLENELRLRSSKLMSSKVATGFVNEILGVVTAYSDQVRAKQISDQFLKGEAGLKKTEKLLRDMAPKTEPVDKYLFRMREHLVKRGVSEADLEKLVKRMEAQGEPKKPRKPRKPFTQAVHDSVSKRLKDLKLEGVDADELAESLGPVIEERAKDRVGEVKAELQAVESAVLRRDELLSGLEIPIVLWDPDGKVEVVNPAARASVKLEPGTVVTEAFRAALKKLKFPLEDVPDLTQEAGLTAADGRFMLTISRVLVDAEGNAFGAILLTPAKGG